ncbi:MAG: hypothetical protein ACXVNM_08560 [Bacteroidia bacterium]
MLKADILDKFENLLEYQQWVRERFSHLSQLNKSHLTDFEKEKVEKRIRINPKWYGRGASFEEMEKGITEYISPELIENIYNQVEDKISARVKNRIKAKKVKYNPIGLGTFVFDRAAMSMYKIREFYSLKHQRTVDEREVRKTKGGYKLISDNTPVEEKEKVKTATKDVYAFFPKINKEKYAVELFISCGGHASINSEQFLYSGVGAIIVAKLLEKARIQTRISIVIGSSPDDFKERCYACVIPVKNYDQTLDVNLLALLTSDPRFFRFEGFKGIISLYDHFGQIAPASLGKGMNKDYLIKVIEKSSYAKTAKIANHRFYFGWTFNEAEAVESVNETIEEIAKRFGV